jgi:hypothetical protein
MFVPFALSQAGSYDTKRLDVISTNPGPNEWIEATYDLPTVTAGANLTFRIDAYASNDYDYLYPSYGYIDNIRVMVKPPAK